MRPIGVSRNGHTTIAAIPQPAAITERTWAAFSLFTDGTLATLDSAGMKVVERETLERFRELRAGANGVLDKEQAKAILRELKAVGGDLRAVRRVLTGDESGPELWSVIAALPRDETLSRIDAAL